MSTIVADADGLIKLGKSGALAALLRAARVLVPEAVWEEAVEEGKRGMHEDAHELERVLLAEPGGVEVVGPGGTGAGDVGIPGDMTASFGAGELEALAVFRERGADAVLTDDRAFLGLLAGLDPPVPALVPTAAIVGLAGGGHLDVEGAREALSRIGPHVRGEAFRMAIDELDGLQRAKESGR